MDKWLTSKEAAEHLGYSEYTLRRARAENGSLAGKTPPKHAKIGKTIRYQQSDLDEWVKNHSE